MAIQTVDPNTNELLKSFEEMSVFQVDEAISGAVSAFTEWRKTSY